MKKTAEVHDAYAAPEEIRSHPAWSRLEDQLAWYDNKSMLCQSRYKAYKVAQLILAATIPIISFIEVEWGKWVTALAGAAIVVLEGVQQLNQYSALWIEYRSTAEYLKHEKHLFLASSGPYRDLDRKDALTLLSERVEEHVSTEHANWVSTTKQTLFKKE